MHKGKVALITGGGTGIGRAVALGLATQGVNTVLNYSRSETEAAETAELVRAGGAACHLHAANVADDRAVRAMIASVVERLGRLDFLVNAAGVTDFVALTDLEGLKEEYWDRTLAVNVKGVFFVCRAAAPHLKQARGSIVNISSIAGLTGRGSSIAYSASKAAVIAMTKSLAQALAPEVRVNSVAPGPVMTRWQAGREEAVTKLALGAPLAKVCGPEDVAAVVVPLLLSAGLVTGQTVVVDGGMVM
ncbi:MAG: SDR family oxidoreductase [Candidatus Methylomirabilota bacterium]